MGEYAPAIIIAFLGFVALAAILLIPVYRFLKQEEEAGRQWTQEIERRRSDHLDSNGSDSVTGQ